MNRFVLSLMLAVAVTPLVSAQALSQLASEAGLAELAGTFSPEKIDRILGAETDTLRDPADCAAAAVMVALGVWKREQLGDLASCRRALEHRMSDATETEGAIEFDLSDAATILNIADFGGHAALRMDTALMASLDSAIGEEVLTGYGLRASGVSAVMDADRTVIYSHSSLPHVKQLIGLVASEGLRGRVMIAPKIAAFVFREGWGERPEWINELGPGIYVAQGPEMLVHFEFERASDQQRFDVLIDRYAKKDEDDETGNLIRSWWQPFYYTETATAGYKRISRVTLSGAEIEASLLMLPHREELVSEYFSESEWDREIDSIWVSAAFFRFLEGDYR